jgi:hypothetical protein
VQRARVAVLLVSPDYLASDVIAREELTPILRAAESEGLRIFWIAVRASIVDKTELAALQAALPPDKPLAGLRGAAVDRALADVARKISDVLDEPATPSTAAIFVEVRSPGGQRTVPFPADRATVGRAVGNDVVLVDDEVSRWHAVFERFGPHWYVRDLSSRNGTCVNGQRVHTERRLQPGDEIEIGGTTLTFHGAPLPAEGTTTRAAMGSPELSTAERAVLIALARPLALGSGSVEPASSDDIARAWRLHQRDGDALLARLMETFDVPSGPAASTRLAEEALRRGAIDAGSLHDPSSSAR